ncbi:MAG TPA: TrkH family potassium uptake protein [Nitrospirae bacterium]|nr:trk system potassium uptake protein TrkH [bacterium BMS3Abin10]GBE39528.1 trk system potassium uptake protein TrkH [bacterium BMS3Bbin08]HDH51494.1 TrkH family potassium uptake protein [Nitrospirota bacterium]HDK16479.1 TrkH family potassium uptake protein [Nitrospirota bacterium]HDK81847.1 TrkH family potassium uptake protein [Nitrospirota bacterium]
MNILLVCNLVGVVLMFSSAFILLPVAASVIYRGDDTSALGVTFLITFFSGLLLYFFTKGQKKLEIRHRDGFAVVTASWMAISLFGSLPYILSGATLNFTNAYFEAMAGFTTTGASVLDNLESIPNGILLWRSLTQWMGGMGIIVFSIAILPMLGVGGMQLFKAEVPDIGVEKLRPRILDTAKSLWYIYAGLTAVLAVLLTFCGMSIFDAVCHAFTTMATGGFSTKTLSIAHFNNAYIDVIITVFMFFAGINFGLHFYALRGKFSRFTRSSEFRFYVMIIFLSITAVTIALMASGYNSIPEALRYASFQVVSIVTTTGYATADYELWPAFVQILLLGLMFFGGMIGSTGGGMKQVRVLLMFKQAYRELYQLIHPHALTALKLDGRNVRKETLGGIWGFLFLFILITVIATLCMSALGMDVITSASTVFSAMANVGPALGAAGPTDNYASIPTAGKWVLIFCMLIGRLEIYTVVILFVPHFWKK